MGVLNITPDSFSDGGRYLDPQAAAARALEMVAQGAGVLDLGAESSRPGSQGVPARAQLRRLLPVLKAIRPQAGVPISIDTQSAAVAEACLGAGADIINDISALRHDPRMPSVLRHSNCRVILMHMLGTPRTMQRNPVYEDVVREIIRFFNERLRVCTKAGIARRRLLIDPGIGFGKTVEHNLEILRRLDELRHLRLPIVVGVSRKSFLGKLTDEPEPSRRVVASVIAGLLAALAGAAILRVHDVAEHAAALRLADALLKDRRP